MTLLHNFTGEMMVAKGNHPHKGFFQVMDFAWISRHLVGYDFPKIFQVWS
jgi:hypothetical protein